MAWCWCNATESKPQNVTSNYFADSKSNAILRQKMKTKTLLFLIINIILFSCAGPDYTSLPQNIKDAKKDNLLYDIYLPNKKSVMINETEYIINDAFTTTKFNSTKDKTINKNVFTFVFKLKNSKTGEKFEYDCDVNWNDYINFNSENGGIHDSNLSISYKDSEIRKKLDTIKIGFLDNRKIENTVIFTKDK
jgi:hypothetical protein